MTIDDHSTEQGQQGEKTPTPADISDKAGQKKTTDLGYPEETPLSEMTSEQQIAYWKHKARKHEGRAKDRGDYDQLKAELDQLKTERMSESEKAVEEARKEGRAEAAGEYSTKMVDVALRTALEARGIEAKEIDSKLSYVDLAKFLDNNRELDSDKVQGYLDDIAPQQRQGQWIDMGQGRRDDTGGKRPGGSVEAGRDIRRNRQKQQA